MGEGLGGRGEQGDRGRGKEASRGVFSQNVPRPTCDTCSEQLTVWDQGREWLYPECCLPQGASLPASAGLRVGAGDTGFWSESQLAWPVPLATDGRPVRRLSLQGWEDPLGSGVVFDS